jgi:hypothetical protein
VPINWRRQFRIRALKGLALLKAGGEESGDNAISTNELIILKWVFT